MSTDRTEPDQAGATRNTSRTGTLEILSATTRLVVGVRELVGARIRLIKDRQHMACGLIDNKHDELGSIALNVQD